MQKIDDFYTSALLIEYRQPLSEHDQRVGIYDRNMMDQFYNPASDMAPELKCLLLPRI